MVDSHDYSIKGMAFSSNSLRILDIRGICCHVWEPAVLVRKEASDDISEMVSEGIQVARVEDIKVWGRNRKLSALAAPDGATASLLDEKPKLWVPSKRGQARFRKNSISMQNVFASDPSMESGSRHLS